MTPTNMWTAPPNTGALPTGFVAPEFEQDSEMEDSGQEHAGEAKEKPIQKALEVIEQQSMVINKLLDMLSVKK